MNSLLVLELFPLKKMFDKVFAMTLSEPTREKNNTESEPFSKERHQQLAKSLLLLPDRRPPQTKSHSTLSVISALKRMCLLRVGKKATSKHTV